MDADFVDGTVVGAYTEDYNYPILNDYYRHNLLDEPLSPSLRNDMIDFLENKKNRSLLIFNINNKMSYIELIEKTKKTAIKNINLLNFWLNR